MKRCVPILISIAGCTLLLLGQADPSAVGVGTLKMESAPAVIESNQKVRILRGVVLDKVLQGRTDPSATPVDEDKIEEAQKAAQEAAEKARAAAAAEPVIIEQGQRSHLVNLVERFYQEVKAEERSASAWALGLLLGGIGCGLVSAICSIYSWNRAAAAASALVVVLGGAQKVYPAQQKADYYRTLTNQSYGLLGALQLPYRMTASQYDDGVARLQVLQEYLATKYPSSGDIEATTQELFRDLTAAITSQP